MHLIELIRQIDRFVKRVSNDNVPAFAAQAAFFVIISFLPFIMFLLTLIQYLPFTQNELMQIFDIAFPSTINSLLSSLISEVYEKSTGAVISLTAITALWSASRGSLAIVRGLNSVYHIKETRNYIKLRLISTFYTLMFALILIATLAFLVFGNSLFNWITKHLPMIQDFALFIISGRTIVGLILLTSFFLLLFIAVPDRKSSILKELPGALITACSWMVFSYAYSFYIDNISNFSYMYGSLAAIVLLMLWLYFCMYIMFIGAELNVSIQKYLS